MRHQIIAQLIERVVVFFDWQILVAPEIGFELLDQIYAIFEYEKMRFALTVFQKSFDG